MERDDRELDDYLRGGSPLSAAYREARGEEPSADLDEVLLEKARREMHLGPKVAWSPFTRSWSLPLALAAVLVVSVTVTLVMHEQTGEPLPVPAKRAAEIPAATPELPLAKEKALAPPPAVRPGLAPAEAPERVRAPAAPVPFPAEKSAPAPREQRAPAAGARIPSAAESVPTPGAERPAAAPALQDAPEAQRLEQKAADSPALRAKPETAKGQLAKDTDLGSDPEVWVRRIETLRKEGRHAEADTLLAEFRKRFPAYPVDKLPK